MMHEYRAVVYDVGGSTLHMQRLAPCIAKFVDTYPMRLSGSEGLEKAIDYIVELSKQSNLENIHTEDVEVAHWSRNQESATLLKPQFKKLPMLGLGYSVATPPGGITAQAVVVKNFEEFDTHPADTFTGKIVVYNPKFKNYNENVKYRYKGALEAAKYGAVGVLVKSITSNSIGTPHTGMQLNGTEIPVASITLEDANMLSRIQSRGDEIVINLNMSATLDNKISRNTIVDLTGSTLPNKYVVVSGHIDNWDVGQGAMDDGGGLFISWSAPFILKTLNLRPRRTLRAVFWTGEELGYFGAIAYEKAHRKENADYNFVMESDYGTFRPLGLHYAGSETGRCIVKEVLKLFKAINTTQLEVSKPGPDINFLTDTGIPGGGLLNDDRKYYWFHHTEGDTMNVLDPNILDLCTAFWTAFSYIVADLSFDIPRQ